MTLSSSDRTVASRFGRKKLGILLSGLCVVTLCVVARCYWGADPASAEPLDSPSTQKSSRAARAMPASSQEMPSALGEKTGATPAKVSGKSDSAIVATVNNQRITHEELARQCRKSYGSEVLESMVNRRLIEAECRRQGVEVTRADVNAEIERMAKRFSIPVDQWMKMLKQERGITPEQYTNDIIWPTLALRKIAGERLTVSRDELVKEFETQYGEAVRARLIAVSSEDKAKKLHAKAAANPAEFGTLAKNYSEDAPSASAKGVINPIRKHGSYKEIENAVFNMADGEISPVIHAGGQYVILKREGLLPARQVKFEEVSPKLEEILRDRKMRHVAESVFRQLQDESKDKIDWVWADRAKRAKTPGVAVTIDGEPITIAELDAECVARHGQETLEGLICRKMLEQASKRRNITVSEADLDAEIAQFALAGVKPKADGSPDVEAWLELVKKKQGMSPEVYRSDVIWPMVTLKKLAGDKVEVTEEDLHKGYEANYGPRVRCLAIVLNNQRRAQKVFEMARKNNTTEAFGELASEYSIEPGSQATHGEVPAIKKHGGQPKLEAEAFSLKPGEISGVIQVGDKFVILRCEGFTKAANVDFASVRAEIDRDLREKKLQQAMTQVFENLQEAATVDNYLAGTSHSPSRDRAAAKAPTLRQVPGK